MNVASYLVLLVAVFGDDVLGLKIETKRRKMLCQTPSLAHGRVRYRMRTGFAEFICNKSYLLAGDKVTKCVQGRWQGQVPFCVKNTCKAVHDPANGFVYPSHRGAVLNFFCKSGYAIKGKEIAYCDGEKWIGYLPTCILSAKEIPLACDFEDEDLCGWSHDLNHDFDWTRMQLLTPSGHIGTGPKTDHTPKMKGNGYYMYIEASSRSHNDKARLISPVYQKQDNNTCFVFWYHMYGKEVGELRVFLKKVGDPWDMDETMYTATGNHGDVWKKGFVTLGSIDDEFQIIIEGVRGKSYLSDIAVDDVSLIENCVETEEATTFSSTMITEEEEEDYEVGSCAGSCGSLSRNESCDCHTYCILFNSCCPDYVSACVLADAFTEDILTDEPPVTDSIDLMSPTEENYDETPDMNSPPEPDETTEDFETSMMEDTTEADIETTEIPSVMNATVKIVPIFNASRYTTTTIKKPAVKITTTTKKPPVQITTTVKKPVVKIMRATKRPAVKITTNTMKPTIKIPTTTKKPAVRRFFTRPTRKYSPVFNTTQRIAQKSVTKYNNNKENEVVQIDKATTTPFTTTPRLNQFKANVGLQKSEVPDTKVSTGGFILIGAGVMILLVGSVALTCALVKRRMCLSLRRMGRGSYGESQSDVRFLTSDEVLDFNLAIPE